MTTTDASYIETFREGAIRQIDREFSSLSDFLNENAGTDEARVVEAALRLRKLPEVMRVTELCEITLGLDGNGSKYARLYRIAASDHFTTLAADLVNLVQDLAYDVLDEGSVRLVRVKSAYQTFQVGPEPTHVRYFLTCNGNLKMEDVEKALGRRRSSLPSHVVSVKEMRFKDLGQFASFLDILADGLDSGDPYQDRLSERIDGLMKPEKFASLGPTYRSPLFHNQFQSTLHSLEGA